eukprot:TRINITY_DN7416_c0_g1_i1.p1 TRINITY_DN7416_c0_g1~~TRINITY_DN7416_c0_g1_i1.p1  ORF type:complete len:460 (+),score=59.44 TRINITY_DN7416_c0_g1_i1:117-1382(+)
MNAFNIFSNQVASDMQLTGPQLQLVAGMGLLGMYLTIPAGIALDKFGPAKTALVCSIMSILGFLTASFVPSGPYMWILLVICIMLISFGSGGVFLCTLGTTITMSATGGGLGVAATSASMSLSLAFTVWITSRFEILSKCNGDQCWRDDFRFLAILQAVIQIPGVLLLFLLHRQKYRTLHFSTAITQMEPAKKSWTLIQSLQVFKEITFWCLMIAYFIGIGSAVVILTQLQDMWNHMDLNHAMTSWPKNILIAFSFGNAVGNALCGVLSNHTHRKGIMSHTTLVAIVLFTSTLAFAAIFLLYHYAGSLIATGILLASVGLYFGCYLVLFPLIVGDRYGPENFGKVFAYVSLSSSAASFVIPQLLTVIRRYDAIFLGTTSLLFLSACLMVLLNLIERRRRSASIAMQERETEALLQNHRTIQ